MSGRTRLTVVAPVYHNAPSLPILYRRLVQLEGPTDTAMRIVFVDDGSRDASYATLCRLADSDPRVAVVRLARNFGSFSAIRAGLDHATGADCVAVISADLQDPPELLVRMLAAWREGNPVVLAVRRRRDDRFPTRLLSRFYYRLMRALALPDMPPSGCDCFLIDRQVAEILSTLGEHRTSIVGLILWLGFRRAIVPYDRLQRPFGRSMWSFGRKLGYAVDSLLAFTAVPLRFLTAAGAATLVACLVSAVAIAYRAAIDQVAVPNWTIPMTGLAALVGLQLVGTGLLGEYVWRALEESRNRPLYVVSDTYHGRPSPTAAAPTPRHSQAA